MLGLVRIRISVRFGVDCDVMYHCTITLITNVTIRSQYNCALIGLHMFDIPHLYYAVRMVRW